MTQSNIPADVRERIIAAAAELYEQAGRENLPTVDAVRRAARADMNTTSAVMKGWRRAQTVQAAPAAVQVPEAVSAAGGQAVAVLWQQAQELANESLRAAQAGWEGERAELDAMRQELADAYETQAAELDEVKAQATTADQAHQEQTAQAAAALASVRTELAQAVTRAERAEAKADEIEGRAGNLRAELDRAHQDADQVRAELATVKAKAEAAATEAHKMAERLTVTQAERDQAREEAGSARERAAELAGQLVAHQEQAVALLARLAPTETKAPRVKK